MFYFMYTSTLKAVAVVTNLNQLKKNCRNCLEQYLVDTEFKKGMFKQQYFLSKSVCCCLFVKCFLFREL